MMKTKLLRITATMSTVLLMATVCASAQSTYFEAVTNLNPTGYWPMHETTPPVLGDIETNYGSLGALGTGYYNDWDVNGGNPGSTVVIHGVAGALTNDPDTAVDFNSTNYSYMLVPHTTSATTLVPPYTLECWFDGASVHTGQAYGDVLGLGGATLNGGGNDGPADGVRIFWAGQIPAIQIFVATSAGNKSFTSANNYALDTWHYVVLTVDTNDLFTLYVDGALDSTHTFAYTPAVANPLLVGAGFWRSNGPQRQFHGAVDEVAIYTNLLTFTDVEAHYTAGTNGAAGDYFSAVTNNHPMLYYRMDSPTYTAPARSSWPVMTNYGSVALNGVYTPGTLPGAGEDPDNGAGVAVESLLAANSMPGNGLSSYGDAGYNAAFDPTGHTPLSVAAWFKGNPADPRFQNILGHSDNSWRIALDAYGKLHFNPGAGGEITSTKVYNDGNWHQVVGVYNGGTNLLYLDGVLTAENTDATNAITGSTNDVLLGADPQYLDINTGVGRQWAGDLCEVAFWNGTALDSNQVTALYSASGLAPRIVSQPASTNVNQGSNFTNTVAAVGPNLVYQWYFNTTSNYAGATALNDGASGHGSTYAGTATPSLAILSVRSGDEGYYYTVVTNSAGSVTSSIVSLTVTTVPIFTVEPAYTNIVLFVGGHVNVSVAAVGALPLGYHWFTNGVADTSVGSNSTNYTYSPALSDLSIYCVASNSVGMATSTVVSVTTIADPTAPYPVKVLADNPYGYWRLNEPTNGLNNGNAGVISHDYWGGNNGVYTNVNLAAPGYAPVTEPSETSALFGETGISFIDSYVGEIPGIDFAAPTNSSSDFSIAAWVKGGSQSISGAGLITKGYGNGGEQFNLDIYNDYYRFFVRDATGATHGYTSSVSPDGQWHHLVGVCDETGGTVTLYLDGHALGSGTITPGAGILESTNVMTIGARRSGAGTNNYDFQFYGNINDVAVYNYALTPDQIRNQWSSAGVPPIIAQAPPATITVNEGGTLTLPAAAEGTPPLTNTWFDSFSFTNVVQTVITGTNYVDGTLVVTNVPIDWDFDTLQWTVANAYGTVGSNVTLTVLSGLPVINPDLPTPVTAVAGRPYTYFIGATGTEPFHYQWFSNGVAIAGETASSYTFNAATANYSVVVTNVYGAVTSTVSVMTAVSSPTNAYATAILSLNPTAYWPMHETTPPVTGDIETNYGSLGALGTGYYNDWDVNGGDPGSSVVIHGAPGALANDSDAAVDFNTGNFSYMLIPHTSPATTLVPPFTMECWFNGASVHTGQAYGDVLGQGGATLNGGGNDGPWNGVRIFWAGQIPAIQIYVGRGTANSSWTSSNYALDAWHYVAVTCDTNDTFSLYVDGQYDSQRTYSDYVPTTWNPLLVAAGFWRSNGPQRQFHGEVDEVATYTNALTLSEIQAHYAAGTNGAAGDYFAAVTNDHPVLYYRMDSPTYSAPGNSTWPNLLNFGSAQVLGAYTPGTLPGAASGPTDGTGHYLVGLSSSNSMPGNGLSAFADAGYDASFNPTGNTPLTVSAWFKGDPTDARAQSIVGHSDNSWHITLDATGLLHFNPGVGSDVVSTAVVNDGNWHHVVGVYDGATSYLYIDGSLDNSAATSGTIAGSTQDVLLGADPQFLDINTGVGQQLAGDLCEVAFWNGTALSATQIQQLYNAAVSLPTPTISMTRSGNQLTITYVGTLLSSTNAAGPYTPVAGASSPYILTPTGAQMFYRTSRP